MTATPETKAPKVPNPKAYNEAELPSLDAGQAWDVVEIGGIDFAYISGTDLNGVFQIVKGNHAKGAQLFNRALRIDAPAKLDARERIKVARKNGTLPEVVRKLQEELFTFDVTTIATRAPRTPPTVEAEDKPSYTNEEVAAMLAAKGIKFVTK